MPESNKVVRDHEEQREIATAWMLVGALFLGFGALVMFFHPAAIRMGKMTMVEIASVMVVIGIFAVLIGWRRRTKSL